MIDVKTHWLSVEKSKIFGFHMKQIVYCYSFSKYVERMRSGGSNLRDFARTTKLCVGKNAKKKASYKSTCVNLVFGSTEHSQIFMHSLFKVNSFAFVTEFISIKSLLSFKESYNMKFLVALK